MAKNSRLESLSNLFASQPVAQQSAPLSVEEESILSDLLDKQEMDSDLQGAPLSKLESLQKIVQQQQQKPKVLDLSPGMIVQEMPELQLDPEVVEAAKAVQQEVVARQPASEMVSDSSKPMAATPQPAVIPQSQPQNDSNFYNILRAAAGVGSGLSSLSMGQTVKPDLSIIDAIEKSNRDAEQAGLNRRQIESNLKLEAVKQAAAEDDLQKAKPESEISQLARDFYKQVSGQEAPANISYNQIDKLITDARLKKQFEEQIAARKEQAASSAAERAIRQRELLAKDAEESQRKASQFVANNTANFQKTTNKDLEKLDEQIAKAGNINEIAELAKTNPMSAAQLGVQVAKAMGEVGALSEADVTRYIANPALASRASQYLSRIATGTLPDENAELIKESLTALANMAKDRRNIILRKRGKQFARNLTESLGRPTSVNDALLLLGEDTAINPEDMELSMPQTLEAAKEKAVKQPASNKVKIREKSSGRVKLVDSKLADKVLKDPAYEKAE